MKPRDAAWSLRKAFRIAILELIEGLFLGLTYLRFARIFVGLVKPEGVQATARDNHLVRSVEDGTLDIIIRRQILGPQQICMGCTVQLEADLSEAGGCAYDVRLLFDAERPSRATKPRNAWLRRSPCRLRVEA